jgi:hypothetical protein
MANLDYLNNENHKVLWHGFDGSVILNKRTGKQEWVANGKESGIPKRQRFTFKLR